MRDRALGFLCRRQPSPAGRNHEWPTTFARTIRPGGAGLVQDANTVDVGGLAGVPAYALPAESRHQPTRRLSCLAGPGWRKAIFLLGEHYPPGAISLDIRGNLVGHSRCRRAGFGGELEHAQGVT